MNEEEINWKELVRYLSGEASSAECWHIERWIASDPENEKFISDLKKIWNAPAEKKQPWNSKEAWLRYQASYGFAEEDGNPKLSQLRKVETAEISSRSYSWQNWGIAAAVILAVFFLSFIVYESQVEDDAPVKMEKFVTKTGQQTTLHFKDGTNVHLNAGSTLKVPKTFLDTLREVWLSGEAYFQVAHNPDKPFVVHTTAARTRVFGTRFDVKAYPEDSQIQVVVAEGLVSLKSNASKDGNLISKHQKGVLMEDGNVNISEVPNLASYIGWRNGKLVFSDEPFEEVVTRLKRWYDLDIEFSKAIANRRLTAQFTKRQPLSQVLDAIALTLNINYTQQDSTISFN